LGRLDGKFSPAKMPLKMPLKLTGAHFTLKEAVLPGLAGNSDMGSGFWQSSFSTHYALCQV
jgi:hypothetical protein